MKMLADLNAAGHTVIIITHDMSLAAEYTMRVIVFHKGKIILDGAPKSVFRETEILRESGLRPPQITRLTQMLQPFGFSPDVTSVPEMYDEFKRVYGRS
jgi:energy-coupling factor transport system ATP-binding protein